ncbi:MAG: flippase-like domain-containing protein [Clostridia bacterium]|nr:flippase-like domain-containing protein [Clostridia bacterium]
MQQNELNQTQNENIDNNILSDSKSEKDKKNSRILSYLMFIINILIVLAILYYNITQNKEFTPLRDLTFNLQYLFIIIAITILTTLLDTIITNLFVKTVTSKSNLWLSYKAFATMRYYDSITPMGSGGQPFMATYLLSNNISGSKSVSIPMKKFLTQQFSWLIITLVGLIYTLINKTITNPLIIGFSVFGFVINVFLDLFLFLGSSSEKITKGFSVWSIKLLTKLKIIKNYDKALEKTSNFMKEYQELMKEFSSNKLQFVIILIMGMIKYILYFSIPFFIFCCFKGFDINLFLVFFTFTIMVELSASCFPLPGGSGMNEITFSVLFSSYLPEAVFWAMLLWRIFSYYLLIFQGIIIMIIDLIFSNKKKLS